MLVSSDSSLECRELNPKPSLALADVDACAGTIAEAYTIDKATKRVLIHRPFSESVGRNRQHGEA